MKLLVVIVLLMIVQTPVLAAGQASGNRPGTWAQPVTLAGVPNLHKVSDSLYRSAQPSAEGMRNLKQMGVQTIVNLRSFHSDRKEIDNTGLAYEHIYMKAWHPEKKEIVKFLRIVSNQKRTPILIHCQHGADRTGTMSAVYRVAVQGWSKEEALLEMTQGGYGFHDIWVNLVPWFKKLNIKAVKQKAGI